MPPGAGSSWGAGGCCWGRCLPDHPCALAGTPTVNPDGLQPHLGSFSPSPLLFAALLGGEAVGVPPPHSDGGQGGGLGASCEAMGGGESFFSLRLPGAGSTQQAPDMMLPAVPHRGGVGTGDLPSGGKGRDKVLRAVITASFKALNSFCNAVLYMMFLSPS